MVTMHGGLLDALRGHTPLQIKNLRDLHFPLAFNPQKTSAIYLGLWWEESRSEEALSFKNSCEALLLILRRRSKMDGSRDIRGTVPKTNESSFHSV